MTKEVNDQEMEKAIQDTEEHSEASLPKIPTLTEIVDALTFGDKPAEQRFTDDVVENFNNKLGGRIDKRVMLEDLKIPNSSALQERRFYLITARVSPLIRSYWNGSLNFAIKNGLSDVDGMRKLEDDRLEQMPPIAINPIVRLRNALKATSKSKPN